jgi:ATP-dependent helicase HrpA
MIGHTQPRRIAARTVAARIAEELRRGARRDRRLPGPLHRPHRATHPRQGHDRRDPARRDAARPRPARLRHDHHRRGPRAQPQHRLPARLPAQLLPRRPDLKVVITSATIDPSASPRTSADAPIVEVSGRTYPVEVRYRPSTRASDDRDQVQGSARRSSSSQAEGPGDVLVFLSGEREIRDTADALRGLKLPSTEVLPLYAGCPPPSSSGSSPRTPDAGRAGHQRRRDEPHRPGHPLRRRPGTARISRYSNADQGAAAADREGLPGERRTSARAAAAASRTASASACTPRRTTLARPEFTDPEILRTNLASVILQMTALGLGDIEAFPFLDPPDRRSVRDGVALLHELGAVSGEAGPTSASPRRPDPRRAARRPAARPDARRGRCVSGCLREVAGHRRRPVHPGPARAPRRAARPPTSPTPASPTSARTSCRYLNLWRYLREQQRRAVLERVPAPLQGRVPPPPPRPRVAGPPQPAAPAGEGAGA